MPQTDQAFGRIREEHPMSCTCLRAHSPRREREGQTERGREAGRQAGRDTDRGRDVSGRKQELNRDRARQRQGDGLKQRQRIIER